MTVQEAFLEKKRLESDIRKLVDSFESRVGLKVTSIDIESFEQFGIPRNQLVFKANIVWE